MSLSGVTGGVASATGNNIMMKDASVSFQAMQKARTTIEDFALTYLPLHGLAAEEFLKYWDVLCFVESAIYSMDEENESLAAAGSSGLDIQLKGEKALKVVLQSLGLLNYQIELQLLQGKIYWQQERIICSQLASSQQGEPPGFTLQQLHAASEAKSFDYRLLNHLLYSLRGRPPDQALLKFLFLDEHLVDIGDDLHDYEHPYQRSTNEVQEDVMKNSFNIFRGYVHLFGREAELQLAKRISDFERRHQESLLKLPMNVQQAVKARQRQAFAVPGSERWVFPTSIHDEQGFRAKFAAEGSR